MRWERGHQSNDVVDQRGARTAIGGGGLINVAIFLVQRFGIWGLLAVAVGGGVLYLMSGGLGGSQQAVSGKAPDEQVQFVGFVLDDVQRVWGDEFGKRNQRYEKAQLVLFTDRTSTSCGAGTAAVGPFYCPADGRAYIDLSFFAALEKKLGAGGDFAQAYVLAHEIGHHVQNIQGTSDRVGAAKRSDRQGADSKGVRLELQADCYAGIWAHSTKERNLLEAGDLEEALTAAAAIGDDKLQREGSGTVRPETFTHGTSEQRARWWKRGYESGKMEDCDTFAASDL